MLHFANSQEGLNVGFLERHLGISYLAAFRMAQRIRWHMAEIERITPLASEGQDLEVRVESLRRVRSGTSGLNRATVLFAARDGKIDCEVISACRQHIALEAVASIVPSQGSYERHATGLRACFPPTVREDRAQSLYRAILLITLTKSMP